jgi:hypothetical protein
MKTLNRRWGRVIAWRWNGGVNLWSSHQGGADHPSATQSRKYGCACGGRTRKHWVRCVEGGVDLGFIISVVYRIEGCEE